MLSDTRIENLDPQSMENVECKERMVTFEDVNRVLEVGRLLFSVLTEEEIEELQRILNGTLGQVEKGNAGVT